MHAAPGSTSYYRVEPFSVSLECFGGPTARRLEVHVGSTSGDVQYSYQRGRDDASITSVMGGHELGSLLQAAVVVGAGVTPGDTAGHFYRGAGQLVMRSGANITTFVFDTFLENRNLEGTCDLRGTATPAT